MVDWGAHERQQLLYSCIFMCNRLTLLGEGHSEIEPRVDDTLEAVVKASHIREYTLIKNPGPSG